MNNLLAIGQLIKARREEIGLGQEELAEKLGVTKSTISAYETGQRKPTLDRAKILSEILNIEVSELLDVSIGLPENVLNLALRAEGIVNTEDLKEIKRYIEFRKLLNKPGDK